MDHARGAAGRQGTRRHDAEREVQQDDSGVDLVVFRWPADFKVPASKGPLGSVYGKRADAKQLQAFIDFSGKTPSAALWQARDRTAELRSHWLQKLNWPDDPLITQANWKAAGGLDPGAAGLKDRNPSAKAPEKCAMDHVVELQVGGTNLPENVAVLGMAPNSASGGEIWQTTSGIARAIRDALLLAEPTTTPPTQIGIYWDSADTKTVPPRPATPDPLKASTCVDVELCAQALAGAPGAPAPGLELVDLTAGADKVTAHANPRGGATTNLVDDKGPNLGVVQMIPGLILAELHRPADKKDTVLAYVEPTSVFTRSGKQTKLALSLSKEKQVTLDVAADGKMTLPAGAATGVKFTYPYLSEGTLDYGLGDDGKVSATGTMTPSLPFLSSLKIAVWLRDGEFGGAATVDPAQIRLPIPGYKTTRSELGLELSPVFRPYGVFAFEIGPSLTGEVTAMAGANGFEAHGTLNARLPGVDKAQGTLDFVDGRWSGAIDIGKDSFSVPYVTSAAVHVGFSDAGMTASGSVGLLLPGAQPVELSVQKGGPTGWIYAGRAQLSFPVPGLKPVDLAVRYDGVKISGEGTTGVVIRGITGTVKVVYLDGQLSGEGTLAVEKGRAKGSVKVKISPALAISGTGDIEYRITDSLIAKAGIVLREDQSVRVSGALEFPQPIQLFKGYAVSKEFFSTSLDIPILGVSVGPASFGLIARITGAMGADLSVGPGELRGARIMAAFNPLDENPDLELQMGAQFVIPAYAGIWVSVRGAIGVSVAIASVTGGLTVRGDLGLSGGLDSHVDIAYKASRYTIDAEAAIRARPVLKLSLDADITAEAGIGPASVEKKWVWRLAGFEAGSDLEFAIIAPLHYASDQPFAFPSLDQIRFVYPKIDASKILPAIVEKAAA